MAAGKQLTVGGRSDLNVSPLAVAGSGNTVINGVIGDVRMIRSWAASGPGQVGTLTMAGSGTLILGAANTYSGKTLIPQRHAATGPSPGPARTPRSTPAAVVAPSFGGETGGHLGGLLGPGSLSLTKTDARRTPTVAATTPACLFRRPERRRRHAGQDGSGELVLFRQQHLQRRHHRRRRRPSFVAALRPVAAGAHHGRQRRLCRGRFERHGWATLRRSTRPARGRARFEAHAVGGRFDLTDFNDSVRLGTRTLGNARHQ